MYRKVFGLISACVVAFQGQALAQNADTKIQSVFDQIQEENYARESIEQGLVDLDAIGTPAALTASILLSQYELSDQDTINARLSLLGEQARAHYASFEDIDWTPDVDKYVASYDGTPESLVTVFYSLMAPVDFEGSVASYSLLAWSEPNFTIPCDFFRRHPDVGQFTIATGRRHLLHTKPLLNIACETDEHFKNETQKISAFWNHGGVITDIRRHGCGSLYRMLGVSQGMSRTEIFYRPNGFKVNSDSQKQASYLGNLRETAFYDWALIGRSNFQYFLELDALYQPARDELEAYHQKYFSFSLEEAEAISPFALFTQLHGATRKPSFSRAMNESLKGRREIRSAILSGESVSREELLAAEMTESSFEEDNNFNVSRAGKPEPLLHLAIGRNDLLREMIELGFEIESRDALGKTTLMAAVQENDLDATRTLLAAGANVNAISLNPKDIFGNNPGSQCGMYNVNTGQRIPLNYALSEASEAVVKTLLEAGAKTDHLDSAGNTMLDYFDGTGPTEKNELLSDDLRKRLMGEAEAAIP